MRRIAVALLSLGLAACAAGEALTEVAKPALDLSEKGKTAGEGDNTGFSRSVAARYAGARRRRRSFRTSSRKGSAVMRPLPVAHAP